MFSLIIRTLKRVGIKLVLKELSIDSYLNFYRIDFIDKYNNWCRLEVFYNDTDFFLDEIKLIGEGRKEIYTDRIINNIKLMGSYEDFLSHKHKSPSKEELDEYLEASLNRLSDSLYDISVPGFSVKEVKLFTHPSMMVFIYFTHNKKRFPPIKIFIGDDINYNYELENIDLFKDKIKEVLFYG